jgi:hypothetical protein
MKTKFVLASFVAALSGFAGLANTANAGTDLRINLNLGLPRPPVLVVSGGGRGGPAYGYNGRYDSRETPRGYWREISVRTWVPARWVVSCDRRGREIRRFEDGYFTYRTDRVWVDGGNGPGYGYGRDNDRHDRR